MNRRGVLLLPIAALGASACVSTRGPSVALDAAAPDFTLESDQGQPISLGSLLRDGPAVLVFYRGYW